MTICNPCFAHDNLRSLASFDTDVNPQQLRKAIFLLIISPISYLHEAPSLALFLTFDWFPVWWQLGSRDGNIRRYKNDTLIFKRMLKLCRVVYSNKALLTQPCVELFHVILFTWYIVGLIKILECCIILCH